MIVAGFFFLTQPLKTQVLFSYYVLNMSYLLSGLTQVLNFFILRFIFGTVVRITDYEHTETSKNVLFHERKQIQTVLK